MTFNPKFYLLLIAFVLVYWLGAPMMYAPISALDVEVIVK